MERRTRHTFSQRERLKRSRDFRRCIRRGGRAAGKHLVVYLARNDLGVTRLGAGSTRRVGKAMARNRQKRLVREAFRLTKHELPAGVDLVVLPKTPWSGPPLDDLKRDLIDAARRAEAAADKAAEG